MARKPLIINVVQIETAEVGLEALAETTQSQAVDSFIEQSCYDRDLPAFGDGICSRGNAPATPVGA